ncbi:MAG: FemAB family XrtA/PEP-CTERM system-associated protein [Planctomycetota bacterium]
MNTIEQQLAVPSADTAPVAPVVIRAGRPADDLARDRFVRAHPRGTFFHLSGWRRVVERVFAHEASDWIAWRGDAIVGVLPLMRTRSLSMSTQLISMPYAVYGGAIGEGPEIEQALVDSAVREGRRERAGRLELRYRDASGLDLPPYSLYSTFIRDLPARAEDVLASIPKKARAECRKARDKHGLDLTEGAWYLRDLQRLFMNNKRNLGSPGLPFEWFQALLEEFKGDAVVHLVHRGREPLAAVMSFVYEGTLLAYYAGTADDVDRNYSASNFMYSALQEWAVERGLSRFDFGRSRRGSGAFSFKEHQGFEPRDLPYQVALLREKKLPSFNPSNPKTERLRKTWSRLPPWVAGRLSGPISRYLP